MMRSGGSAMLTALALLAGGPAAAESLVIAGGTVHPVSGGPFVGTVVVDGSVIHAVAPAAAAPPGARAIDASGLHVYPGLFDAMSTLGLLEIGSVPATNDRAEIGSYNPHLRAATAIHPASEVIPVTRANGVTHAIVAPQSERDGVIAGQAAAIQLAGWTIEEMALDTAIALVIRWPPIETSRFDLATFSRVETPYGEAKEAAEAAQQELRGWFDAARHYRQAVEADSVRVETDLKLAALARCLDGGMPVIIIADAKREIEAALAFAEQQGLRMILAGGRDAHELREVLAERKIPVILGSTLSLPDEDDLPYDTPFRNPGELAGAGVLIAFASAAGGGSGPSGPHTSRTLPYEAAAAIGYGLPPDEALRALTINPAKMLGLDDRLGSIETGKLANLIVTDGDPLDIRTRILHVVIAGREVPPDNRHLSLYRQYRAR